MSYVVIDLETTGLDYRKEQVIEIAAVRLDDNFNEVGVFNTFVKLLAYNELPEFIKELTGITDYQLTHGMWETEAFEMLNDFIGDSIVVAQFAPFDLAYLTKHEINPRSYICTKSLASKVSPNESSSLGDVCTRLGISLENAHRAIDDARATAEVLARLLPIVDGESINSLVVSPDRPLNFIPKSTKEISLKGGGLIVDYRGGK